MVSDATGGGRRVPAKQHGGQAAPSRTYGKIYQSWVNPDIKYLFTGQELEIDQASGLWNFRARLYDNEIGLFYAIDPAGQTFAPYSYCAGNPISLVDPTGRNWNDIKYYLDGVSIFDDLRDALISQAGGLNNLLVLNHLPTQFSQAIKDGKKVYSDYSGYYVQNTMLYPSGYRQGYNNLDPNNSGYSEGTWIVDGIHRWNWLEWSVAPYNPQYFDFAESFILDRMQNRQGFGNEPFVKGGSGKEGYGQGPKPSNIKYKTDYRNDCSERVRYACLIEGYLSLRNASDHFGNTVDYDPSHLQVIVWPGQHVGLTKGDRVYDMTASGFYPGNRTIKEVSRYTNGVRPVYYEIR